MKTLFIVACLVSLLIKFVDVSMVSQFVQAIKFVELNSTAVFIALVAGLLVIALRSCARCR
jgi:phage-related holin